MPRLLLCAVLAALLAAPAASHAQGLPGMTPDQLNQVRMQGAQSINSMLQNVINPEAWMDSMHRHLTDQFIIWVDLAGTEPDSFGPVVAGSAPPEPHYNLTNSVTGESTRMTRSQYEAFLTQHRADLAAAAQNAGTNNLVEGVDGQGVDWDTLQMNVMLAQIALTRSSIERRLRNNDSQILSGRTYTVAEMLPIYAGWDPAAHGVTTSLSFPPGPSAVMNTPHIDWYGPSSAMTTPPIDWLSPSSAGSSLPLDWYLPSIGGPLVSGSPDSLRPPYSWLLAGSQTGLGGWQLAALAQASPDLARGLYGPLWSDRRTNPWDNLRTDSGTYVGNTSGLSNAEYLRLAASGDLSGLQRLLAQPFNILVTWGSSVFDIDLHMTGPDGAGGRFHIYYANPGSLASAPYAQLIRDCICNSGSEVILTSNLLQGGVYRISAFNFGDQSATSTGLSTGGLVLQVVRGGTPQGVGQGTTIVDGHVLFTLTPPPNGQGNTWEAVEIDPATGRIYSVNHINTSPGSGNVP